MASRGGHTPALLTVDGPHQSSSRQSWCLSHCGTNVNEVWRSFWDSSAFWCSYTHSGALLLHLIYCEGPTPSSAWCCHLRAERGVSLPQAPCHHRASQSKWSVAAPSTGLRTGSFLRCFFAVSCGKLSQTKYTVQGRESTVIRCMFGNPFTEKIVLRVKGRPWKTTVASGSWRQMHWIN